MESNNIKRKLQLQIRESYGKLVYTYTSHWKMIDNLKGKNVWLITAQISFSVLSVIGYYLGSVVDRIFILYVGGISSLLLVGLNLYLKKFNLKDEIRTHKNIADELWKIREEYISLLTDIDVLDESEIKNKRDELLDKTYNIYTSAPGTNSKSYSKTQDALKNNEEQFFTQNEIDQMLPTYLRITEKY